MSNTPKTLRELQPDKRNANKGTAKGAKMLVGSVQRSGAGRSGVLDKNNNIIAGNKFTEAAAEVFGVDVEPIIVESDGTRPVYVKRTDLDLNDPDPNNPARQMAYSDNIVQWADFTLDSPVVMADIEAGFNFEDIGVLPPDLGKLLERDVAELLGGEAGKDTEPQVSRADELQKVWNVQLGQVWVCGEHRIICGDCTDRAVVEKVMAGEKADLVFTDPPYGVAIGNKNIFLNTFQPSGRCLENIAGDLMGKDELLDMLVKSFTLTREFMNDCCAIYVTAPQGGELGLMMMMMMMMSGLPVRHVLNWVKNAPTFSMGRLDYEYKHEPILYTWKETHKHYGNGKFNTSVWEIDKPIGNKEHPTMKPVELVENAILNSSDTNQLIYDPFCGSGTTIIAANNTNRRCRAIEVDPKYCSVVLQRFLDHSGIQPVLLTE